jgi:hypothetical protein
MSRIVRVHSAGAIGAAKCPERTNVSKRSLGPTFNAAG